MSAAAYNMGINGAMKSINNQGSNNYYNLYLNSETSRYIFRILAVKTIMESPKDYGFIIRKKDLYPILATKNILLNKSNVDIVQYAKDLDLNYKLIREYNPWIRSSNITNSKNTEYKISVPIEQETIFLDYVKK